MHLIRRFLGFLFAQPLTPREQQQVRDALDPGLARLFFAQRSEDQRHGFEVYQYVEGSNDLSEAALLHDIGKTDSYLGAVGRSLATLWNGLGRPTNGRWQSYLDHGSSGALLLEDFGANRLAISFTRHHPGSCPRDVDIASWRSLEEADDA